MASHEAHFWQATDSAQLAEQITTVCYEQLLSPSGKPSPAAWLFTLNGNQLTLKATAGTTPKDNKSPLDLKNGALKDALQQSQGVLIKDPAADPQLQAFPTLFRYKAIYLQQLATGDQVLAVLLLAHTNPRHFTRTRLSRLENLAASAAATLSHLQQLEKAQHAGRLLVDLYNYSRMRQARALHDGPTQAVAALALQLNYARRLIEKDPAAAIQELKDAEELARRTTIDMRNMLFTLHPLALESGGLAAALESLIEKTPESCQQSIELQVDQKTADKLDPFTRTMVFYLAVEALSNTCKHAPGTPVRLRFTSPQKGMACLEIEDDGPGFDPADTRTPGNGNPTPGLVLMRQYAALIRGELVIDAQPGQGTRLAVTFPINPRLVPSS